MLDARLQAIADFVPAAGNVADIGTDHAYLAVELHKINDNRKVIATELNIGPCDMAKHAIEAAGLTEYIEVRLGNGLAVLQPGEVDTVCIAGMGGKLEADILAAAPKVMSALKCLVLQPQNGQAYLRRWLYENGWHITDETVVKVDGRLYQIIKAQPGKEKEPEEAELILGPILLKKRPELFSEHLESNINALKKVGALLRNGGDSTRDKLQENERKIKLLEVYRA